MPNGWDKAAGLVTGAITGAIGGVVAGAAKIGRGVYGATVGTAEGVWDGLVNKLNPAEIWEINRLPLTERYQKRKELIEQAADKPWYNRFSFIPNAFTTLGAGLYNAGAGLINAGTLGLPGAFIGADLGLKYGASGIGISGAYNTLTRPGYDEAEKAVFGKKEEGKPLAKPVKPVEKLEWTWGNTPNKVSGFFTGLVTGLVGGVVAGAAKVGRGFYAGTVGVVEGLWDGAVNQLSTENIWEINRLPLTERYQRRKELIAEATKQPWYVKAWRVFPGSVLNAGTALAAGGDNLVRGIGTAIIGGGRGVQLGVRYGATGIGVSGVYNTLTRADDGEKAVFGKQFGKSNPSESQALKSQMQNAQRVFQGTTQNFGQEDSSRIMQHTVPSRMIADGPFKPETVLQIEKNIRKNKIQCAVHPVEKGKSVEFVAKGNTTSHLQGMVDGAIANKDIVGKVFRLKASSDAEAKKVIQLAIEQGGEIAELYIGGKKQEPEKLQALKDSIEKEKLSSLTSIRTETPTPPPTPPKARQ